MALTYRLEKGTSLTHEEMDNNFRSLFFSSSLANNGLTLRLHYDTSPTSYQSIQIGGSSTTGSITNNTNNYVLTATGTGTSNGESNLQFNGEKLTVNGRLLLGDALGNFNILIGTEAGDTISTGSVSNTIAIGYQAAKSVTGNSNTALGHTALSGLGNGASNLSLGFQSLSNLGTGNNNVALGALAGDNNSAGSSNVYIGYAAGPGSSITENNKLYINNAASATPLLLGDFSTGLLIVNNTVSASAFSGSFSGDGSGLTGLSVSAEWDGTLDGNAQISGSLIVSGAEARFTGGVTGSSFTGSFVGDGSGLTGVTSTWNGIFTGSAEITGSLQVTGPSILTGTVTLDTNITVYNPSTTSIAIGYQAVTGSNTGVNNTVLGYQAGLNSTAGTQGTIVGFKAGDVFGNSATYIGEYAGYLASGIQNTAIGVRAMGLLSGTGQSNTATGFRSLYRLANGSFNTAFGASALEGNSVGINNTAIGSQALLRVVDSNNTALGRLAGQFLTQGSSNVYLGREAGPSVSTIESNQLYIHNSATSTPLIRGNFSTRVLNIYGELIVSQSVSASAFIGDGSGLTNIVGNWDGAYTGSAGISGSLNVVGSVEADSISGSFSGSYIGDGSGLTGVQAVTFPYTGSAIITGSLSITGGLTVDQKITIRSGSLTANPFVEMFQISATGITSNTDLYDFLIGTTTGYTGFKADYSLTNSTEDSKKIGTLHGGWDRVGNSTINDTHTNAVGDVTSTGFNLNQTTSSGSILQVTIPVGTYDLNMIITAFKKQ